MRDHLDRTIEHFVEEGRIPPEVAAELSRDLHHRHVDVRQRLAEFAGYVGAGLATLGVVVIGASMWEDVGQLVRVLLPATAAVVLLVGARVVVRGVPRIAEHPVRGRIVQVMGVASAVMAALATATLFTVQRTEQTNPWQMFSATLVGLVVMLVVSRWSPGFIATSAAAVLTFLTGVGLLDALGLAGEPVGWVQGWMVLLGATAALVLHRFFPPPWLTRALGVGAWLLGSLTLIIVGQDDYQDADYATWMGRGAALVLVVVGTWMFVRGGDWPWAAGAAVAAALLVGLWFAGALNAGIALIVAGLVLIAIGAGLAGLRRASHHRAD
jgi:hypothetical protein